MRHRRILFGLAVVLSLGIILYTRSRTRRWPLVRRVSDPQGSAAAPAAERAPAELRPTAEADIVASPDAASRTAEPEVERAPDIRTQTRPRPVEPRLVIAKKTTSQGWFGARQLAGAALIIIALGWSFGSLAGANAAPTTYVSTPTGDAFVWASHPDRNYGNRQQIRVDGSPTAVHQLGTMCMP